MPFTAPCPRPRPPPPLAAGVVVRTQNTRGKKQKKKLELEIFFQLTTPRDLNTGSPLRPRVTVRQDQSPALLRILRAPGGKKRRENRGDSRGLPGSRTQAAPGEREENRARARSLVSHPHPLAPRAPTRSKPVRSSRLAPPPQAHEGKQRRRGPSVAPTPRGTKKLGTALGEPIDGRDPSLGGATQVHLGNVPLLSTGVRFRAAGAPIAQHSSIIAPCGSEIGESREEERREQK